MAWFVLIFFVSSASISVVDISKLQKTAEKVFFADHESIKNRYCCSQATVNFHVQHAVSKYIAEKSTQATWLYNSTLYAGVMQL